MDNVQKKDAFFNFSLLILVWFRCFFALRFKMCKKLENVCKVGILLTFSLLLWSIFPTHFLSVCLYFCTSRCPLNPPIKKFNSHPSYKKMIEPHTHIFFYPPQKKGFILVLVFISALVKRVFVPVWRIFNSDFIQEQIYIDQSVASHSSLIIAQGWSLFCQILLLNWSLKAQTLERKEKKYLLLYKVTIQNPPYGDKDSLDQCRYKHQY